MQESEIHRLVNTLEGLSSELGVILRVVNEKGESLGDELPCVIPPLSITLAVNTGTRSTTSSEGFLITVVPTRVKGEKFLLAIFGEVTQDTGYRAISKLPELLVRGISNGKV